MLTSARSVLEFILRRLLHSVTSVSQSKFGFVCHSFSRFCKYIGTVLISSRTYAFCFAIAIRPVERVVTSPGFSGVADNSRTAIVGLSSCLISSCEFLWNLCWLLQELISVLPLLFPVYRLAKLITPCQNSVSYCYSLGLQVASLFIRRRPYSRICRIRPSNLDRLFILKALILKALLVRIRLNFSVFKTQTKER